MGGSGGPLAMRTCVRYGVVMTAQGSPISVLRRALKGGSLGAVDLALIDVPQVDLQDALEIVALMAEAGDPRFARWAERWAERAAREDHSRTLALLRRLPEEDTLEVLRERAEELRRAHPAARLMVGRPGAAGDGADGAPEPILPAGEEVPRRGAGPRSRPPMP